MPTDPTPEALAKAREFVLLHGKQWTVAYQRVEIWYEIANSLVQGVARLIDEAEQETEQRIVEGEHVRLRQVMAEGKAEGARAERDKAQSAAVARRDQYRSDGYQELADTIECFRGEIG